MNPSEHRGHLTTEQTNPRSTQLDVLSTKDLVQLFIDEDRKPQEAVAGASEALTAAVDAVSLRLSRGGRLFYLGAGTSGRLGVLDAAECPPTFWPPELVQVFWQEGLLLCSQFEGLRILNPQEWTISKSHEFGPDDCLVGIAAGEDHALCLGRIALCTGNGCPGDCRPASPKNRLPCHAIWKSAC